MNLISMERSRFDPIRGYRSFPNPRYLMLPVITGILPEYYYRELEEVMERFVGVGIPLLAEEFDIQGYWVTL